MENVEALWRGSGEPRLRSEPRVTEQWVVLGLQTVLIQPRYLTCGPLSVNVLHHILTEAISPVAHRDPQPSSAVGGTALLS